MWSNAEADSLPLVGLTAWEMLHCHFGLVPFSRPKKEETLVIVNGAGGVGTMATQLARYVRIYITLVITSTHYSLTHPSPPPTLRFSESKMSSSLPLDSVDDIVRVVIYLDEIFDLADELGLESPPFWNILACVRRIVRDAGAISSSRRLKVAADAHSASLNSSA